MNLRTRLRALILVTLLPVVLFGAAAGYQLLEEERDAVEQGARDRVLAVMTAIDAELGASIAALEILALSPSLARDDLNAFRAEALRALEARSDNWANIFVSDAQASRLLMNAVAPPGMPLRAPADGEAVRALAVSLKPSVSELVNAPLLGRRMFSVRVPVVRDGQVRYMLSAAVEPSSIARVIDRQSFPAWWSVGVLDGNYRFVVRLPGAQPGGTPEFAAESLKQALSEEQHGWRTGRLVDGTEIFRAFHHSSISNWSTSIAIPQSMVNAGVKLAWLFLFGVLAAGALGLWVAWVVAARITRPLADLAAAAPALGSGDTSALRPPGTLPEVRELWTALHDAALAIREREELQKAAEQALRAADRAKDEFLAMLGHELRNPLGVASNATQLMQVAQQDPANLERVRDILSRQVEHMSHLVDDLLEVGRVAGGKVRLECVPLDLARAAGDVIEAWQSGKRFANHQLSVSLSSVWVSADPTRIHQMLSNLLDNALKYTPAGGDIKVTVKPEGPNAVMEVRDAGGGISPELIGRIFDLFVQGERSMAREHGGLGIGLTLVKRLVDLHGGSIQAASDGIGKGAVFTLTLPAQERPPLAAVDAQAAAVHRPRRILIVEDNAEARETLAELLALQGHEVHQAATARAGIEAAGTVNPDVSLIDIGLPDADGYEVARRLRAAPATSKSLLIAVSGYGTPEDRRRSLASGFDEHLSKPLNLKTLSALIRKLPAAA